MKSRRLGMARGGCLRCGRWRLNLGILAVESGQNTPGPPLPECHGCPLTDSRGIAPGTPGAPAWAAMQSASLATHVMVGYLPGTGPGNATLMINTLV